MNKKEQEKLRDSYVKKIAGYMIGTDKLNEAQLKIIKIMAYRVVDGMQSSVEKSEGSRK